MGLRSGRCSIILVRLFALFLLGTIIVLALIRQHFRINEDEYIRVSELGTWEEIRASKRPAVLDHGSPMKMKEDAMPPEKIPRIIHQTWKTEELPPQWAEVREGCARLMPDYEYMLWTDAISREFIEKEYPWFLPTFDAYPHNIQRADAIRYFVLHKYGGVYMDLDIGCQKRLDSLLRFDLILPKTIPVGVSNDLMFSVPGHSFMDLLIRSLNKFNHRFFTHYATVMFSTGPMFVSTLHRVFASVHEKVAPSDAQQPGRGFQGIRVLPKSLYGKNLEPDQVPDSFFVHMYGSSWHAGDAGFLIFLRKNGYALIFLGVVLLLACMRRSCFSFLARLLHTIMSVLFRSRSKFSDAGAISGIKLDDVKTPRKVSTWYAKSPDVESKYCKTSEEGHARPSIPLPTISMNDAQAVPYHDVSENWSSLPASVGSAPPELSMQRRGSDTNTPLPTFYVDHRSTPDSMDASNANSKDARVPAVKRISSATSRTFSSLIPPPLRRFRGASLKLPSKATTEELPKEPPTRHSDEYHSEWERLVQDWESGRGLRSPTLHTALSPAPEPMETLDEPHLSPTSSSQSQLLRRSHHHDPYRPATPAVFTSLNMEQK